MILQGFEIENWACIKKLSVANLPPSGVIVLHGPNRTGKTSVVQALRACLMDYASSSTALKSWYPRGTAEKPSVCVTFAAGGGNYRIKKCFGSSKSEFAQRTAQNAWKVETTSPAEAHTRVCDLAGGDDSSKGLRQLLWLTQAEFRLPEAKKFDLGVQTQLRGILGVLQTPLDDRFIGRVKDRWNAWFSGQRKAGKKQEMKAKCALAEKEQKLRELQDELTNGNLKFAEMERLLTQVETLQAQQRDLAEQLKRQLQQLEECEATLKKCQLRIANRNLAEQQFNQTTQQREAVRQEQQQRTAASARLTELERGLQPALEKVATINAEVASAEKSRSQLQTAIAAGRDQLRQLQVRTDRVARQMSLLTLQSTLEAAEKNYRTAKASEEEIEALDQELQKNVAPTDAQLATLKSNRPQAAQLRAELNAASISLDLIPENGTVTGELVVDGGPRQTLDLNGAAVNKSVRRNASLAIPHWGRVEIRRGTAATNLDQLERHLRECEEQFAAGIAPFGVSASDPQALDLLIDRAARQRQQQLDLAKTKKDFKLIAPQGLAPLLAKVTELQTKVADAAQAAQESDEALPTEQSALESLAAQVKVEGSEKTQEIEQAERQLAEAMRKLDLARKAELDAKQALATCKATVESSRNELGRLATEANLIERLAQANAAVEQAEARLKETVLSNEEQTIGERHEACTQAVKALREQIREVEGNLNRIKGRLEESEGLHTRRAACAVRVDELTRFTEAESLERDAVDRLYELFEECREKQLGALTTPIQERVLGWMRVLDLGDYHELRFSDAFLPDKLVRSDGTAEFAIDEESTGAQEQIGMLVRLALGSLLTSPSEPAVAILDDPLTHCDVGRLTKMCAILRRAAEGDSRLTPPAGPLQIIILTCHPEWFRSAGAMVINLEDSAVMQRLAV
jgi:DNA repair exonuclease SbcCD ATPase subunit